MVVAPLRKPSILYLTAHLLLAAIVVKYCFWVNKKLKLYPWVSDLYWMGMRASPEQQVRQCDIQFLFMFVFIASVGCYLLSCKQINKKQTHSSSLMKMIQHLTLYNIVENKKTHFGETRDINKGNTLQHILNIPYMFQSVFVKSDANC